MILGDNVNSSVVQVIGCKNNKDSSYNNIAPRRTTMKKFNSQDNVLNNLPTLGLRLRKTQSFVNLIEEALSKQEAKNFNDSAGRSYNDRHKASNFPAKVIKIGSWEVVSLNESQLVAKCYYAKRKLIWEVMEDGLKSKIEIQWSDISAIRATMVKDEDGILEVELSAPPTFSKENIPLAGKHSSWYPCPDFTGGQASTCRIHYLRFPPGFLDKPYKTLLHHELRIFEMNYKPFPSSNNPYFTWVPPNQMHCMAVAQAQLDNFGQFSITKIPRDMTMSNQILNTETTMQNASHVTRYSCQMPDNDLPFGAQVMDQVPGRPVRANSWTTPEMNNSAQVIPIDDSNSLFRLDTLTNMLPVNDFTEPNNLDLENLSESQKAFVQNFVSVTEEEYPNSNKKALADPTSLHVNSVDDGQSYQQPAPPSNHVQFSDNPNLMMDPYDYRFANAPSCYSLPEGLNNYLLPNHPHDMVYNEMDPWKEE